MCLQDLSLAHVDGACHARVTVVWHHQQLPLRRHCAWVGVYMTAIAADRGGMVEKVSKSDPTGCSHTVTAVTAVAATSHQPGRCAGLNSAAGAAMALSSGLSSSSPCSSADK